jgi:hypothetical protein
MGRRHLCMLASGGSCQWGGKGAAGASATRTISTCAAVVVPRFGGPQVLEYKEVVLPELCPNEVLVRTRAAAVNPLDIRVCFVSCPEI